MSSIALPCAYCDDGCKNLQCTFNLKFDIGTCVVHKNAADPPSVSKLPVKKRHDLVKAKAVFDTEAKDLPADQRQEVKDKILTDEDDPTEDESEVKENTIKENMTAYNDENNIYFSDFLKSIKGENGVEEFNQEKRDRGYEFEEPLSAHASLDDYPSPIRKRLGEDSEDDDDEPQESTSSSTPSEVSSLGTRRSASPILQSTKASKKTK